jgi:hypothetical protein
MIGLTVLKITTSNQFHIHRGNVIRIDPEKIIQYPRSLSEDAPIRLTDVVISSCLSKPGKDSDHDT